MRDAQPQISGVTMEAIKQKLEEGIAAVHVEIEDMSGMYPANRYDVPRYLYFAQTISYSNV